jgi:Tol biopolymer transport system component
MTAAGVILGTAAYMSPEQARGKPVDKRSDLWAFGVILFEMLTGTRLFAGETISDTVAAVLRADPDFDLLPNSLSASASRLLRRCLQRDPRLRIRSAGDAALDLIDTEDVVTAASEQSRAPRWVWGVIAVLALSLVASFFVRPGSEHNQTATRSLHLDVVLPEGLTAGRTAPAISPDGRWFAFAVRDSLNRDLLYLRSLREFTSERVVEMDLNPAASGGVGALFWSPDSKRLGIQTDDAVLTMDVDTRSVQRVQGGMVFARGASWSRDNTIIYAPSSNSGLHAVDLLGNPPRAITSIDSSRADASHRWPVFLPDGKRFLFTMWSNARAEQEEIGGIYLGSFDGTEPERILKDASQVIVDPAGYLLFHRNGKLMQVAFDFAAAELKGNPSRIADDVSWDANNGSLMAGVSASGDLVLATGGSEQRTSIGWLDLDGGFEGLVDATGGVFGMDLSWNGRYAAVMRLTVGSSIEIWIADLERSTLSLLTRFDGATEPTELAEMKSTLTTPTHWSSNGQLFYIIDPRTTRGRQIWVYDFETGEDRSLLAGDFEQTDPVLSPDGRWLAYASTESGRSEVFVRPYPALNRKWQISTDGGSQPHWRDDGKQLMYASAPGRFYTVEVSVVGDRLEATTPILVASFDREFSQIVPDAKHVRFLCSKVEEDRESTPFRYISNWRAKSESASR